MRKRVFSYNSGQTLLEMVIALTVAVLVVIALVTVTIRAIRNAQIAENRTQAARYAQQAIEQARVVRDQQGWTIFSAYSSSCYQVDTEPPDPIWVLIPGIDCTNGDVIGTTIFRRKITMTDDGSGGRDVKVVISWTDASGPQTSTVDTKLTKWLK